MFLTQKVTIGRSTKNSQVDIDLSNIELNKKISRNQCSIKMIEMGVFVLYNHGKLPVYVDGKIILKSCKTHVYDKSIIEVNLKCFFQKTFKTFLRQSEIKLISTNYNCCLITY